MSSTLSSAPVSDEIYIYIYIKGDESQKFSWNYHYLLRSGLLPIHLVQNIKYKFKLSMSETHL